LILPKPYVKERFESLLKRKEIAEHKKEDYICEMVNLEVDGMENAARPADRGRGCSDCPATRYFPMRFEFCRHVNLLKIKI